MGGFFGVFIKEIGRICQKFVNYTLWNQFYSCGLIFFDYKKKMLVRQVAKLLHYNTGQFITLLIIRSWGRKHVGKGGYSGNPGTKMIPQYYLFVAALMSIKILLITSAINAWYSMPWKRNIFFPHRTMYCIERIKQEVRNRSN